MSTPAQSSDLEQLTRTVTALAQSLERSERRHAHLSRAVRWGSLAVLAILITGATLIANRMGLAHAQGQGGGGFPQAGTTVEALNNINNNLAVLGMMGGMLQQAQPAIEQAMMGNPDVQAYVKAYLESHGIEPTPENMMAYSTKAVIESGVSTMVDVVVLMQRIRQDSNAFRDFIEGPTPVLEGLERELKLMNVALASVPAMAVQMDLMNRNMASMTHSMGSTMGRMGSWMPGW